MTMKKIYAQNDLQVVIQNFLEPGGSVSLIIGDMRFVPFIKREIIHMLGTPSWDDHTVLRYSEPKYQIRLVSKASDDWEQKIRGIPRDEVYYVEGWNVDDARHSPYCMCEEPDEAQGYYVSAEGKLVEDNICDVCGRRISGMEPVSAEGNIELVGLRAWVEDNGGKRDGKPPEFKSKHMNTWVNDTDD